MNHHNVGTLQGHRIFNLTSFLSLFLFKAVDHLESFIADCDRRTELAKKRLAETQEEISAEVAAKVSKHAFINIRKYIQAFVSYKKICTLSNVL